MCFPLGLDLNFSDPGRLVPRFLVAGICSHCATRCASDAFILRCLAIVPVLLSTTFRFVVGRGPHCSTGDTNVPVSALGTHTHVVVIGAIAGWDGHGRTPYREKNVARWILHRSRSRMDPTLATKRLKDTVVVIEQFMMLLAHV